jgi:Lamin Tail Domain
VKRALPGLLASLSIFGVMPAVAAVAITEVAPWSSGNSPVGEDWFEVTNTGASMLDFDGWRMDDSSANFASAVPLRGVGSIAAGASAIFIESNASGSNDAAVQSAFLNKWFGGAAPAGLQIGFYGGSGIGLSTGGDAVNIFDSLGVLQASVAFSDSPGAEPFASFDNPAGLNDTRSPSGASPASMARFSPPAVWRSDLRTRLPPYPNRKPTHCCLPGSASSARSCARAAVEGRIHEAASSDFAARKPLL